MRKRARVTTAPWGISNERHNRQACLSKVVLSQIQEPTPHSGSNAGFRVESAGPPVAEMTPASRHKTEKDLIRMGSAVAQVNMVCGEEANIQRSSRKVRVTQIGAETIVQPWTHAPCAQVPNTAEHTHALS